MKVHVSPTRELSQVALKFCFESELICISPPMEHVGHSVNVGNFSSEIPASDEVFE